MLEIKFFKRLSSARLPVYATGGAAGADVYSANDYTIYPGDRVLIDTGLDCRIPEGYEIQVRSRSGLALKQGVIVLNSPGTVDSDYTGPLGVILYNGGHDTFNIKQGDRIAQIVVAPVIVANFSFTQEDKITDRGASGFGSTGI